MRGQWKDYESFSLIDLIDETKTRFIEPSDTEYTLQSAMIIGKNYYGTIDELKKFLTEDDNKVTDVWELHSAR